MSQPTDDAPWVDGDRTWEDENAGWSDGDQRWVDGDLESGADDDAPPDASTDAPAGGTNTDE